ncbi:L,D-transpeptidase [Enterobacter cloacae]|uniref:ErfK/YbiS/YcfS/YnhG family protein n=1 Tax=Enterobacter cloacae subsp. cloacae (strain ATCC 13047 / DSM 30054 / NBRC 13535 / NCTC 10005 / WDCM 00083 / NCDC 279-56) TaxID=716541 RepID=A0A0H3CMM4_ENTCC|nr:L,D-transpeptidase [Enterobacter cloacae]ADF62859.1 ErfK/YbiS/YcfS/YnhG family protein [Enterobacter cloacae subsp. cloacae ATCC 13047]ELK7546437.1 L,D-transpeptidase [Enterobacter cloacae]KGB11483.1 putative L,D-transpeptidase ErfK/SrfK [Enterobacter cloacae]MBW4207196.1 L,D-transpeptidase [Enterobacter cloacae subsp. cloacae]MBW4227813.1 L,D-transpeptidase [Enterobacter cloacae subsp. cloacae]
MRRRNVLGCLAALLISQSVQAVSYPLPPAGSRLVGSTQVITVPDHNTLPLEAFTAQHGQGLSNMLEANPGVDPFLPQSGTRLVVPQQLILPDTVRKGIVVNVAEMRLYYYPPGSNTVEVFPIGIGQAGRETPRNWVTAVERKQEGPTWSPTPNTRREYAKEGKTLPAFVPAGPDNPMGLYALYIGRLYAIHGTNSNFGIGLRVSQGCIRLRNNDIKYLFDNVSPGTRVQLIDQPVKVTTEPDGSRWVEVHEPLSRNRAEFESTNKVPLPITPALRAQLINEGAGAELERRSGMPVKLALPGGAALTGPTVP